MIELNYIDYKNSKRKLILKLCYEILEETVDIIAACRIIFLNWNEVDLPLNCPEYNFLNHLDDELEEFNPDYRDLYDKKNYLKEEKEFILYYTEEIKNLCNKVIHFLLYKDFKKKDIFRERDLSNLEIIDYLTDEILKINISEKFNLLSENIIRKFSYQIITSDLISEVTDKIELYLLDHEDLEDHEIVKEHFFAPLIEWIKKLDLNDPMFSKARLFMTNLGPFSEQYVEELCPGLQEKFK